MDNTYIADYNNFSERPVEVAFIYERLMIHQPIKILDVGGIPTRSEDMKPLHAWVNSNGYTICDLRGGKYKGDFNIIEINEKFDAILFLSSIEHFPQCTEGDMIYREDYDKKAFKKAYRLLNQDGTILITVPFGKPVWQKYHQNYDLNLIHNLVCGHQITALYTYGWEQPNLWIQKEPKSLEDTEYTDHCYAVACIEVSK